MRNWKKEIREAWDENKEKLKIGAIALFVGLSVGFYKGISTQNEINSKLIDKIPNEPDCDDIDDWCRNHMDELKNYFTGIKKEDGE